MKRTTLLLLVLSIAIVAVMLPSFGKKRTALWLSDFPDEASYQFPVGFLWGAASAAQHVESQQASDWTAFELDAFEQGRTSTDPRPGYAKPGHINSLDKYSEEVRRKKTNYDEVYDQDFLLAEQMGHNAYRFSISWARLFPREGMTEPDPEGVAFYQRILDSLKQHHLMPLVSFFHFSSPQWLWQEKNGKKGWEREDALVHYQRFVQTVLKHYGDQVNNWCTLNEPMTYVFNGYIEGVFPPLEQRSIPEVIPVIKRLLEAHALTYRLIHEHGSSNNQQHLVGIAKHTRAFEPMRNWAPLDRVSAAAVDQAFLWDFLDAIQTGVLKVAYTDYVEEIPGLKGTQDYVGINYYGRYYVKSDLFDPGNPQFLFSDKNDPAEVTSDLGWAIYPHGFYLVLTKAYEKYGLPIYVLENGIADHAMNDTKRQQFLVSHLREVWNAINHGGADIRGYMHWSFIDNFEWAEGFTAQFGLVKVDYDNNFQRIPKPSADVYTQIIQSNAISDELMRRYAEK